MNAADTVEAAAILRDRIGFLPRAGIVLGSGLGGLTERISDPVTVPFTDLPGFPPAGIEGHVGAYVGGRLAGMPVVIQAGRYHIYEGHGMGVVAAPVRSLASLGIEVLILTNAAGGIDSRLEPGQAMLITNHLNLMGRNPLTGPVVPGEERFPDMSTPYDEALMALAHDSATEVGETLAEGVYAAVHGPSYETAAEIEMLRQMGANAVGMSTVPEVIVARARGIRCLAFSNISNRAAGLSDQPIMHSEVIEVGRAGGELLALIVEGVLRRLA